MGNPCVCSGALLQCSFGVAPSTLNVLPLNRMMAGGMPVANLMDNVPMLNILPFGMCSSMANPQVAAATAVKLGVMTPMPCIPMTAAPWMPGSQTVVLAGKPVLHNGCKAICSFGGIIQITNAGTTTVQVS